MSNTGDPETGWKNVSARLSEYTMSSWAAVRHYFRIRPIPGTDSIQRTNEGGAISFNDLFKELYADWRLLLTCVAAGFLIAIIVVLMTPPTYMASQEIAPAPSSFEGANPSSAGQSVLSLISGKSNEQYNDYAQFLNLLHSVRLAKQLDKNYGLMKHVFPFDKKTDKFVPAPGVIPWAVRTLRGLLGLPRWEAPSYVDLANYLTGAIEIKENANGTGTLVHYGKTPQQASEFLSRAFAQTDSLMREEELNSHRNRRKYVAERLKDTATLEQRDFLMNLWGREESQILLLTSGDPVGARKIDDMHIPSMPQTGAKINLAAGLLLGLLLGLILIVARSAVGRS